MSAKSDHIDLNSDAVLVDGETEVDVDNVTVTKTLMDDSVEVILNSSSVSEDIIGNADVLGSLHDGDGDVDESVLNKNPNDGEIDNVPKAGGCQNDMEIDNVPKAAGDFQNDENEFQLVVDLNSYVSSDVNVKSAVSKPEFHDSDLVWGKVRSHPWWPGQIFDISASSVKAKKYFKKDSYLIAYFGDQTFAWNEASRIKPFRLHFSQMEKQSNLDDFHYAVDCALEEVSRRVEFGLACSCISEDVYDAKIRTQIIVNAGIREEYCRIEGGDSFSSAAFFEPVKPVEFIKELAQQPLGGVDKLEFVTARAQLLAFYRWKGYSQLPELKVLGDLLESDADIPVLAEVKHGDEVTETAAPGLKNDEQVPSQKGKSKSQDGSSGKRKHISSDSMRPSKKEKSLSELMSERRLNMPNGQKGSDGKAGGKLISSSSGKKRKAVDAISDDTVEKRKKGQLSLGSVDESSQSKQTFRVGNSILKVANQLNGSSLVPKNTAETSHKTSATNNSKEKSLFGKSQSKKHFPSENSSPDEMLSQLCLAARDPMKKYSFLISIVSFFSEFRNSVSLDPSNSWDHEQCLEQVSDGDTGEKSTKLENTEASELDLIQDSYWTDRIIEGMPGEQLSPENQNEAGEFLPETPSEKGMPTAETQSDVQLSSNMNSEWQTLGGNLELEAGKPVAHLDDSCDEDLSPTALILNFTDLDSVPSATNLNAIFSRYGPLNESETEVLKKSSRAKVVFKRRADAETAFSSAGKYSTFGPSLVSYRLKYMPSTSKASPNPKQSRKDATPVEGNAT